MRKEIEMENKNEEIQKVEFRKLDFEKINNARDLGGLTNREGRSLKQGLLIRAAHLSDATEGDVKKLEEVHHLALIVDLRTGMERQEKPDVVPETAVYQSIPVFDERMLGISHEKSTDENRDNMVIPALGDMYRMMVTEESCRRNLGRAAQTVMEHDFERGSVLWHCTEGKDRCGLLAAVLLSALGVDRQVIMEDYLLTNEVNGPKAEMFYQQLLRAGKSEAEAEAVKNVFLAKESYLNGAFSVIDGQYADMETFLRDGLYIPEEAIGAFREKVLQ